MLSLVIDLIVCEDVLLFLFEEKIWILLTPLTHLVLMVNDLIINVIEDLSFLFHRTFSYLNNSKTDSRHILCEILCI